MTNNFTRGFGLFENFLAEKRYKIAKKLLGDKNGKIVDIGCGKIPHFLSKIEFKEKYGVDRIVENKIWNGIKTIKLESNQNLPFDKEFFDAVSMLAVVEHMREKEALDMLKETRRILRKGGAIFITTPTPLGSFVLKIMGKMKLVSNEEIKEHKSIWNSKRMKEILQAKGFKNIKSGYVEFLVNRWYYAEK